MLKEAANKASNLDIFTHSGDADSHSTHTANEQTNRNTGCRGAVEGLNDPLLHKRVDLGINAARATSHRVADFVFDQFMETFTEPPWSDHQFLHHRKTRHASEAIECLSELAGEGVTASEQTQVGVDFCRRGVVVSSPHVGVATNTLPLTANNKHRLGVSFQASDTINNIHSDSPIVQALITAARNGKQVTAVIELKARFDEAANIQWARMMREAGVDVVYGVTGLKTHAKAMLIIRSEGERIRRYAHMGTGNYHPSTAKIYTDLSLLTCRDALTSELAETFNCLTGVSRFPMMKELMVAPWRLCEGFHELIENEIGHAMAGRPCGIYAKVNSLVEEGIIEALYRASAAGVPIRLLVRGMCAVRVGIPGVSENIEVRSLVGRFLEHSRIYRFENGGDVRIYLGSSDWMPRNLFRRVETVFPITAPGMIQHVDEILSWFWKDNVKSQVMQPDGVYRFRDLAPGEERFDAQMEFLADALRRRKKVVPVKEW